jgi:hypothetical protein
MISAKLIGRLGNSMFQIAASIGYARKYGYQWAVQEECLNNESSIHRVYPNLPKTRERGITYNEHPNEICPTHGTHYDQCRFDYHPIANRGDGLYLLGFWQSYKYFEGSDEEIKKVFALPKVEGYEDYVSIHVRRGDYVQHSGSFPPVDLLYIDKAIGKIHHETGLAKFIVFSDDIEWCKSELKKSLYNQFQWEFSEGRNELQDLSLMASCGHHIIANSTFSWWGAYLGHNPNRIVISPSHKRGSWFGLQAGVKKDCVDLLPPNWIQIER